MDQTQRRFHIGIIELDIKLRNLRRLQEPFVDDCPGRKRGNVKHVAVFNLRGRDFGFDTLANDIQLSLEGVFGQAGRPLHEDLLDVRLRASRNTPYCGPVDRNVSPA